MNGYTARGHRVWHLVGRKRGDDPNVILLPDDDRLPFRVSGYTAAQSGLRRLAGKFPHRGFGLVSRSLRLAAHPATIASRRRGLEDFDFPGSAGSIARLDGRPDVVHGHNLQGDYFDLRALVQISARVPTMLTLHDMWLLTGHCAYSLGCERWKNGCGDCPDLHLDPPIQRDATKENCRRKQDVVAAQFAARGDAVTMAGGSGDQLLARAVDQDAARHPERRRHRDLSARPSLEARTVLGLSPEAFVVLLTTGSHGSMWKDDRMLKDAVKRLSERRLSRPIEFLAVGRESAVVAGTPTRSILFNTISGRWPGIFRPPTSTGMRPARIRLRSRCSRRWPAARR